MRIGTFKCWLFGHLFAYETNIQHIPYYDGFGSYRKTWDVELTNNCVRCGLTKQKE